ncbi:hypothetical protein [Plantibacter sp. YIM 135249]|jgi:hypothetical protein|uniref:hypothetical protein n=1 Tax=Plantibacter sp. YIM 135249 TaxID=3423918 RepID=UPI003D34696F
MFGRRRHAAPVSASKLTEKQLFDLVHARLADELGATGAWVLSRRLPDSGDEIFHDVFAQQLAHEIATDIDLEQAAVTVRAEAPARGWRLWGRADAEPESMSEDAAVAEAVAVETAGAEAGAEFDHAAPTTEAIEVFVAEVMADAAAESAAEAAEDAAEAEDAPVAPVLVERTLLEPQHYPIAVWAEPDLIDASLVNPVPARNRSIA